MKGPSPLTAVVLAAGQSRRLGVPKQLCLYEGRSLLARSVDALRQAPLERILVVTGAERRACQAILASLPTELPLEEVYNPAFAEGMGSSIAAAARFLLDRSGGPSALLLLVCDQLYIDPAFIARFLTCAGDEAREWRLTATRYQGTFGVPALFPASYLLRLSSLSGEKGAKSLLQSAGDLRFVDYEEGSVDIDRPEDLRQHQVFPPVLAHPSQAEN